MKKTFIFWAAGVFLLALLTAGLLFLYENLKNLETQREAIVQAAKAALNRDIQYDQALFSLHTGPAFTFTGLVIKEKDGAAVFASSERLILKIAILPLLKKELVIKNLQMYRPRIAILRDVSGIWNIADLLEKREDLPLQVGRLTITEGSVAFQDRFVQSEGVSLTLKDLNLRLRGLERGDKTRFDLKTAVIHERNEGRVAAEGSLSLPVKGRPWQEIDFDMRLRAQNIDLNAYGPYYRPYVTFASLKGALDVDTAIKGSWPAFSSSGTLVLKKPALHYPQTFSSVLSPERVQLAYDMKRDANNLSLKKLNLSIDALQVQGSATLSHLETRDPVIDLRATMTPFSYERYRNYIPFGIIPKNVAAYIRDHIQAGNFHLVEGSLSGRLSQIRNMNQGNNAHVLQVRVGVNKGVLTYGKDVPPFKDIKGELALQGADFLLKNMSGHFGDAPLTLEGAIRNYCLDMPSIYPFRMTMKPGEKETAWLIGAEWMKKVKISGSSLLQLSGEGLLDDYKLTGDWDLAPVHYTVGPLIKSGGRANRLKMTAGIRKGELQVRNFQYHLAPISLSGTARYRFKDEEHLSVDVRSNVFDLKELAVLSPDTRKYQAAGPIRLQLTGRSRPRAWKDILWRGDMTLEGVSIKPRDDMKTLQNLRGIVQVTDQVFSSSALSFMLGQSSFRLQGRLANVENPTADMTVASDFLDVSDLGWQNPKGPVRLRDFKCQIVVKKEEIRIPSLSASLNASIMNARLSWARQVKNPVVDFQVTAPVLNQDDILLMTGLEKAVPARDQDIWSYRGSVNAGKGKLAALDFIGLQADIVYREPSLVIKKFHFNTLGGHFSGTGSADMAQSRNPRYDFDFQMNGVPAASLLMMTDISPNRVSGSVSSKGHITASGTNKEDFKKTLQGAVDVQVERGVLREFAVLSKIFSILNVSQLLKFQLPDMAVGGMPFSKITATVSMQDGLLSTDNAFLKSDAMNMIAVGKLDLFKETMDMAFGLQPLQSIDKVVSRIPVLGWILTDTDKRFITVSFEAKGPWKDPSVRAVPVREMAKEVLNIFKRILQLPVKLFTDTGEVLLP